MTSPWRDFPSHYRQAEINRLLAAIRSGSSAAVIGLSGAGKSNLLRYLSQVGPEILPAYAWAFVDLNRLRDPSLDGFFRLLLDALPERNPEKRASTPADVEEALSSCLEQRHGVVILFDRFDALSPDLLSQVNSSLRSVRDTFKYQLSYIIATRREPDPRSELAELFFAHTFWVGPLSEEDARWSAARDLVRMGQASSPETLEALISFTWGYPAFLRAACEAYASGARLLIDEIIAHPAVQKRLDEFWADQPQPAALRRSGLEGHPFFLGQGTLQSNVPGELTLKEHLLWSFLQQHAGQVCEKDALIRAVWPEDKVFEAGIRDDSLAQLVRRLRKKIEPDPDQPVLIQTIPGRGYLFRKE